MFWDQLIEVARQQQLPLATVITELLHTIILNVLYSQEESLNLVFQGGTSIHLLHGGYRYSQDLDFAGGEMSGEKIEKLMQKSRSQIEKWIIQCLGMGKCEWKLPKKGNKQRMFSWWLFYRKNGERRPYRIKMEFTTCPVYQIQIMPIRTEYGLPFPLPLINGLGPVELLAEKISAIAGRPFIKGRDFFDLWFLSEIKKAALNFNLVQKKFNDYQTPDPIGRLQNRMTQCGVENIWIEMSQSLPVRYRRQFEKNQYQDILKTSRKIIKSVLRTLGTN
ncbi:nucleotidyl transferase AbiEii/AbiGii toxin family protein [candidate division KSB1 bacterium]|nr:nucleotidyl transferase AbiEii/AbiGii toxin family protein [candidate division KSB1 bacterium]